MHTYLYDVYCIHTVCSSEAHIRTYGGDQYPLDCIHFLYGVCVCVSIVACSIDHVADCHGGDIHVVSGQHCLIVV